MKHILVLVALLFVSACKPAAKHEPTVDDIKKALSLDIWTIKTPHGSSDQTRLALCLLHSDKEVIVADWSSAPGTINQIMVLPTDEKTIYKAYILNNSTRIKTSIEGNIWNAYQICKSGSGLSVVGQPLIYGYENTRSRGNKSDPDFKIYVRQIK